MPNHGKPVDRTPLERLLRGARVEEVIDRLFRFIEMIVIATLISVVLRVVSVEAAKWVNGGLCLAAGLYLGAPSARWIALHFLRPSKGSEMAVLIVISLGIAAIAVVITSGLRVLLSQTFQIDEPRARIEYKLWEARTSLRGCGSPHIVRSPNDIPACERRWKSEIKRLEAKEQVLRKSR
jgi:hypothetical protein